MAHTTQNAVHSRKVMMWGCFSEKGLGPLVAVEGTMNTSTYISMLENHLLPQSHLWFPHGMTWTFQHDNAPCHKSRGTLQSLINNNVVALNWPPYSPDLNPIENLWAIVKKKVHATSYSSIEELIQSVKQIWDSDVAVRQSCRSLVYSMTKRIQECIKNGGGPIRY